MRITRRSCFLPFVLLSLTTPVSHSKVNPDIDFSALTGFYSTGRSGICLNSNCPPDPVIYGALQGADCNQAGRGTPLPITIVQPGQRSGGGGGEAADPLKMGQLLNSAFPASKIDLVILDAQPMAAGRNSWTENVPRIDTDMTWDISDNLELRASYGTTFRAPTIQDLYPTPADALLAMGSSTTSDDFDREVLEALSAPRQDVMLPGEGPAGASTSGSIWDGQLIDKTLAPLFDELDARFEDRSTDDAEVLLLPLSPYLPIDQWPGMNIRYPNYGSDAPPIKGTTRSGYEPSSFLESTDFGGWVAVNYMWNTRNPGSRSINGEITDGFSGVQNSFKIDQLWFSGNGNEPQGFATVNYNDYSAGQIERILLVIGIKNLENNWCRVVLKPVDPKYLKTGRHGGGSWGQKEDDQWAIKRIGYTDADSSAWNMVPGNAEPVVIAVIDTGLDWHHLDIDADSIWRNEDEIPDNFVDDDNNGFVDDIIGWNFMANNNRPWDFDGHGTVVAGIIAAAHNDQGIAGINPNAKIMVLKAINNFGTTRASYLAHAIKYAADNGAQIINLSVGGPETSRIEQAAIDYAASKGVLVIAAAGNEGVELDVYGPGGRDNVLTVGATHVDDRTAAFSNYGERVDLVAPGVDVLSLRARFTDANYRPLQDSEYELGQNVVGEDKRYLHVSGTSFATPMVAATASLVMAKDPSLTASDVERRLLATAEDIELPGVDKYSGHGMIDARAALGVDPDFFVTAEISGVDFVQSESSSALHVNGTIDANGFKRAWMQIGPGENPGAWKYVGQKRKYPIRNGTLGVIPISAFKGADVWQVVINVEHSNGVRKSARYPVKIN